MPKPTYNVYVTQEVPLTKTAVKIPTGPRLARHSRITENQD